MRDTCFEKNQNPLYLIGTNYWSRNTGPLMWRKWEPVRVREELMQMKNLGMNACRSFLYFPDFMPLPHSVDRQMLDRLAEFLDFCEQAQISTLPTFFVGHMSGEDWDVGWREGRDLYLDPWMIERESIYVGSVVDRVKTSRAIIGWILTNEITNYAGIKDPETILTWVRTLCNVIRERDPSRPIGSGDGAWGREIYGVDNGFRLDELKEVIDFYGLHFYHEEDDTLRHSYTPSFITKMCNQEKPILVEEFGCSNSFVSEDNQADYYRTTLNSTFLAGAVGALSWCYSDFDLPNQRPYSHHPFELLFGVTRKDGTVKPAGEEMKRFSKIMDRIELSEIEITSDPISIIVPSYYIFGYPYSSEDKDHIRRAILQSYILTRQAHLNCGFFREPKLAEDIESTEAASIPQEIKLLFAPNTQKLTAPFWEAIYNYVEAGGIFYCSYHHDMWIHIFDELFGAKHNLRSGLADLPESGVLEIEFLDDFFYISKHEKLSYRPMGSSNSIAFCPLTPMRAETIAVTNDGRPAIVRNSIGRGKVIFSAYPLEHYLATNRDVFKVDLTYRLYRSLSRFAGITPIFDTPNPFVEFGTLRFRNGERFLLWIINHGWEETDGFIESMLDVNKVVDFENGQSITFNKYIPFDLPRKGVRVYDIHTKKGG